MPTVTIWHATWCASCKGTIERVVPRLREEGVEPALADVDLRPCAARDQHVVYLPTVTVGDSEGLPYQPFFDGATKRIMELSTGRGRPGGRPHPRVQDVTVLKAL